MDGYKDLHAELRRRGADTIELGGAIHPEERAAVAGAIQAVPEVHRHVVHRAIMLGTSEIEKYYAAIVMLRRLREMEQSNSTVTLMPQLAPGALAVIGQVYPLFPLNQGINTNQPFQFSLGMFFRETLTGQADSVAGWFITQGSFKFSDDPLSGVQGDTSFEAWRSDVVTGRAALGVYFHRKFLAPTNLNCSAVLLGPTRVPMIEGVTIGFTDNRCNFDLSRILDDMGSLGSFGDHVRWLVQRHHAGHPYSTALGGAPHGPSGVPLMRG